MAPRCVMSSSLSLASPPLWPGLVRGLQVQGLSDKRESPRGPLIYLISEGLGWEGLLLITVIID